VAKNPGELDLSPPFINIEVGSADAGTLHLDEYLARGRARCIHLHHLKMSLSLVHKRSHTVLLS
jgi:hypothetical protein